MVLSLDKGGNDLHCRVDSVSYTHLDVYKRQELGRESIILMEQIRTIDKSRLVKYMGSVGEDIMEQVDGALKISLGFKERP